MSNTRNQEWLEAKWEDADHHLSQKNWAGALAIKDEMGNAGFELDAVNLFNAINSAKDEDDIAEEEAVLKREEETGRYEGMQDSFDAR